MKRLVAISLCILFFSTGWVIGQRRTNAALPPGMLPYIPTRIEWLALELEASYRSEFSSDNYYSLNFISQPPDTIMIVVQYSDQASGGIVDSAVETARTVLKQEATRLGWSQWVKTDVQRKYIRLPKSE